MRRYLPGLLLLGALPVILAFSNVTGASVLATQDVTIDARCSGGANTSVTLRPWNLRIRQGDNVRWVLNANANSDDITITPKREAWPFTDTPPYKGRKGRPAIPGAMRPNAQGRYSYNVTVICTNGARSDTVQIDPDIIVD